MAVVPEPVPVQLESLDDSPVDEDVSDSDSESDVPMDPIDTEVLVSQPSSLDAAGLVSSSPVSLATLAPVYPNPAPVILNPYGVPMFSVDHILDHRYLKNRRKNRSATRREFLVHWTGFSDEHNEWVKEEQLKDVVADLLDSYLNSLSAKGS